MKRELTTYLKGIAVILMVMHHSFGNPQWYISSINYAYLAPYVDWICDFAGFAVVPIFCFLTGWTYYLRKEKTLNYSLTKIVTFLIDYWLILFGFAAIAHFLCGYQLTWNEIGTEMLSSTHNIMLFSWFVFLYIEIMLFLPYFAKLTQNYSLKQYVLLTLGIVIFCKGILAALNVYGMEKFFVYSAIEYFSDYIPIVISAYLCAKYDYIAKLAQKLQSYSASWITLFLFFPIVAYYAFKPFISTYSSVFLCPLYIALLTAANLNYNNLLHKVVVLLGKHSMNIWFLQCIFFAAATREVFQEYAYIMQHPLPVVMWILFLCTIFSFPLIKVQHKISTTTSKFFAE